MDYKVCILAAGKGTRNKYAEKSNKALLPLGDGTALSYIISKFPKQEIVIAIGHNHYLIEGYVFEHWYERVILDTARISNIYARYEGKGVGPGYSLLTCKDLLQCPFVYMACDTIVLEDIPEPSENWIGISQVKEKLPYLTMKVDNDLVKEVYDKGDKNATFTASIGLFGIHDYEAFWGGLAHPQKLVQGEHQDTSGLNALIPYGLHTKEFTWFDTGSTEGYEQTKKYFESISRGTKKNSTSTF